MGDKIKVFEAFAGYGSQSIALRNIGVDYEVVAISEIDKYAIQAYEAIHGQVNNLGDITKIKVEDIPQHDLFTYSFPCQDISVAGKQNGMIKNETRSGLLYECEKIIEHCRPKYLLMENVKNLLGRKFKPQFDEWLAYLETLGYTNYYQVLNAKDYGIPQNRDRVFCISILGEHKPYNFPKPNSLNISIKDMLDEKISNLTCEKENSIKVSENIKPCVRVNYESEKYEISISDKDIYQCKCSSGWQDNKVGIKVVPTLRAGNPHTCIYTGYEIRKITPKEAFKFMGMLDCDIDKIQSIGISDTQQYKLAGNSIVVPVLEEIFRNLLC